MKKSQFCFNRYFVVAPEWTLPRLCEVFSNLESVSGQVLVQPPDSAGIHWATGELSINDLHFVCVISSCPIDQPDTTAEIDACHNHNGATNTFKLRMNSFKSDRAVEEIPELCGRLEARFSEIVGSISFDGTHFMWIDYQS